MIKLRPPIPRPPHVNPELSTGRLYEVKHASTPAGRDYIGRVFTYLNARSDVIWLVTTEHGGGYDDAAVLRRYGLEYKEVDVQLM